MKIKSVFTRYELKYLVTKEQQKELLKLIDLYMTPDEFGQSSIYNLYYDTATFLLIRRSLDKPVYKEKLRLRSYLRADSDTQVFLELKKKHKDIVYKRRISLSEENATGYFENAFHLPDTQIGREIDYFKNIYEDLAPRVWITYDRQAFFGKQDDDFRITFDENILWREEDLSLCSEKYGNLLLDEDLVLMEVKVTGGMALWLTHFLTENQIYKTSFSKYGNVYKEMINRKKVMTYDA